MKRIVSVAALLLITVAVPGVLLLRPLPSQAGPDKIAFPTDYKSGVLYTVADRHDIKQYRELYASPGAVEAAKQGKPLPHGTVLTLVQYKAQVNAEGNPLKDSRGRFLKGDLVGFTVMEKRQGWGAEYPDDLRNGEWEYSVFSVDGKFNDKANFKACFQCHKPHDGQDFVISYPALAGRTVVAAVAPPAGAAAVVNVSGFVFTPGGITVPAGKPVVWTNADDSPHQVTVAGTNLKTGLILKGDSAALTFKDEGVFNYNCALHPNMKGSVQIAK